MFHRRPLAIARVALGLLVLVGGKLDAAAAAELVRPHLAPGFRLGQMYGLQDVFMLVEMSVSPEGDVQDLETVAGFYEPGLRDLIFKRIRSAKFKPALLDGQPVQYYRHQMTIVVRFTDGGPAPKMSMRPAFRSSYEKVVELTKAGDHAGAADRIRDLIAHKITTLYEYAFLNQALVPIAMKLGAPEEAWQAIVAATRHDNFQSEARTETGTRIETPGDSWPYFMPRQNTELALRQRFALAVALQKHPEALATYDELASIGQMADNDPVRIKAAELRARIRSAEPLKRSGRIGQGSWEYLPQKRRFTVQAEPASALRDVAMTCTLHREQRDVAHDVVIELPEEWGANCRVTFHGNDGAIVSVME